METVRSKDGTAIAFERHGKGPALFIVAGALSDRRAGSKIAGLLSGEFTAYSYDRRGRGDSGDTAPYRVEREIEDLAALIEHAGGPALVFGHSSGAVLALKAAERLPSIRKLAVYEPPFITDSKREPLPQDFPDNLSGMLETGRSGEAVEYFLTVAVQVPAPAVQQMRQSPAWAEMEKLAPTLLYDLRILGGDMSGRPPAAVNWKALRIPVLAMDGGASPGWARAAVEAVAGLLPDARRSTLEGQTHGADPAVLAPVLAKFFRSDGRE